jgi:transposase
MWYVALDLSKRFHYAVAMNEQGAICRQQRLPHTPEALRGFVGALEGPCQVVIEASGNWMPVYDWLEPFVQEVVLAHPLRVRAIASARIKTDRIDATTLAHLLRADLIPRAYIPPRPVRIWRELVRHRAFLVRIQTRVKNRVHALLMKQGVSPPEVSDLFGRAGQQWLTELELPEPFAAMRSRYLAVLAHLREQLRSVEQTIDQTVTVSPQAQLLQTIPGVGRYLSLLILGEIGEIARFPSPKQLVSFAGLCPSTYASGQTLRHGRLIHQGSPWLRWGLIEVATHAGHRPGTPLARLRLRLAARKDPKTARVAVARKLCTIVFHMLQRMEPYREPSDALMTPGC